MEVLWEKHLDTQCPPAENTTCTAFKEYKKVTKMVPLDFREDDITWVASNIFSTSGALEAEAIELRNGIICFMCASD